MFDTHPQNLFHSSSDSHSNRQLLYIHYIPIFVDILLVRQIIHKVFYYATTSDFEII